MHDKLQVPLVIPTYFFSSAPTPSNHIVQIENNGRAKRCICQSVYQFSSNMFHLPLTRKMFCSLVIFILRFHETGTVNCTGISLASSFPLRNLHSAFTKFNTMDYLWLHSVTSKARSKWSLCGEGKDLTLSQGRGGLIFNLGKYYSLR